MSCKQVSKEIYEYESKLATDHALVSLGIMMTDTNSCKVIDNKYKYLLSCYKDYNLSEFNNIKYMNEYEQTLEKTNKVYELIKYINILIELHQYNLTIKKKQCKKIEELKDMLETVEHESGIYICSLDEYDIKYKNLKRKFNTLENNFRECESLLITSNENNIKTNNIIHTVSNDNQILNKTVLYYKKYIMFLLCLILVNYLFIYRCM